MIRFLFFFVLFWCSFVKGAVIKVSKSSTSSIKQGIALAKPGDTVLVQNGIYRESPIIVDKPLHLIGSQMPILDGERKYEILIVKANNVTIEGFHFKYSGFSGYEDIAGLRLMQCRNVLVMNNHFTHTFFGVYSQHVISCSIVSNTFHSTAIDETLSGNGIHCWKSDSLVIKGNTIRGHRDGIYFEFVTHTLITGNISTGNVRYGLHFMFSNDDSYVGNQFIDNGAGVAVMYSKRVTMLHNSFKYNRGAASYGILLKDISDSYASGNLFEENTVGIFMDGSSRFNINGNVFKNNGWALRIQASCDAIRLSGNNFFANSFDVATNGSLVLNDFDNNYWDKYRGYDLNRDGKGDKPFRPVSLFSMITERNTGAIMLFRSSIAELIDQAEKIFPGLTPEDLKDNKPAMKPFKLFR
ncbi:MAG: nitrous oxide reductase family maturation protein NosD [Chitinophagaceae bacterium]|nr:nitrous oxide reductase family maturation protein NosD [Chitinophagaceae bacterium]